MEVVVTPHPVQLDLPALGSSVNLLLFMSVFPVKADFTNLQLIRRMGSRSCESFKRANATISVAFHFTWDFTLRGIMPPKSDFSLAAKDPKNNGGQNFGSTRPKYLGSLQPDFSRRSKLQVSLRF